MKNLRIFGFAVVLTLATACSPGQIKKLGEAHNDSSFSASDLRWGGGGRNGGGNGDGGRPTNPNGGGYYGCNWEAELDLNQCVVSGTESGLEIYDNTSACRIEGNMVVYTLHVRGIEKPNQRAPIQESFSRKRGAVVTIYHYSRSCSAGGQVQNQHNDTIYQCDVYADAVCRFGEVIF